MTRALPATVLLTTLGLPTALHAQSDITAAASKIALFVGPQTRDGFIDVDSGILDSLKDITDELRQSSQFTLAGSPADAVVVLTVVGRRAAGQSGSVGIPVGTAMMFLPIKRRAIDTILKVGAYEKAITSEDENTDRWRATAKKVVKDVLAWVEANRASLAN